MSQAQKIVVLVTYTCTHFKGLEDLKQVDFWYNISYENEIYLLEYRFPQRRLNQRFPTRPTLASRPNPACKAGRRRHRPTRNQTLRQRPNQKALRHPS